MIRTQKRLKVTEKIYRKRESKKLFLLGALGAKHTVLNEEQAAFADWINNNLNKDQDVAHKLN